MSDLFPGEVSREYDLYTTHSDVYSGEIVLRNELRDFLFGTADSPRRGFYILYRRASKRQLCSCVNPQTREKESGCTLCSKMGFVFYDEMIMTYLSNASLRVGVKSLESVDDVGISHPHVPKFYFQHTVDPSMNDEIIVCNQYDDGTLVTPVEKKRTYNILNVIAYRDINGRIAYYSCISE